MGQDLEEDILKISNAIVSESNSIVKAYNGLKHISKSSLQSQALLQLKSEYCDKNNCLQCAVGNTLITK